jgi:ABC-type branched-subunit amino acid transport system substrate-binding protein
MKNKKVWIIVGALVIVMAIILAVLLTQKPMQKEERTIKIGAILPLTGPGSGVGEYTRSSALLVNELYSSKFVDMGFKVEFTIQDSKSSPTEAIFAYKQLTSLNPDINVILTQMSSIANALAPLAEQDSKVLVSISSTLEPMKVTKNFFVNYIDSTSQSRLYLDFFKDCKSIILFYINDEYGRSVKKAIDDNISEKLIKEFPFEMNSDPKNLVLTAGNNYQGAILVGYGTKLCDIIKNLRIQKFDGSIACSAELLVPGITESLKGYEDKIYVIDFASLPTNILSIYEQRLKRQPTIGDILTYNAVTLLLETYLYLIKNDNINDFISLKNALSNPDIISLTPSIKNVTANIFVYSTKLRPLKNYQ